LIYKKCVKNSHEDGLRANVSLEAVLEGTKFLHRVPFEVDLQTWVSKLPEVPCALTGKHPIKNTDTTATTLNNLRIGVILFID
jgi:hypothetical protein